MRFRFFSISAQAPDAGEAALNAFCASHRVANVERNLVSDGAQSFWAVCVTWVEGGGGTAAVDVKAGKLPRIDYREILSEADFTVFAALRALRKEIAEREGVPPYALFTNEQLAAMATGRTSSMAALGEIEGVGASHLERFGVAFLAEIGKHGGASK